MSNSTYLLAPNGELYHAGIKGMKWGVRRYQNKDGSLTPAGKKRYWKEAPEGYSIGHQVKEAKLLDKIKNEKDRTERRQLKKEYKELTKLGKQKIDEYRQFEKDMHNKVGKVSKIKATKNPDGTYTYTNKKGQTFKQYEVQGAADYEIAQRAKNIKRGERAVNAFMVTAAAALTASALVISTE